MNTWQQQRQQRQYQRVLKSIQKFFLVLTIAGPLCFALSFVSVIMLWFFVWGDAPYPDQSSFLSILSNCLGVLLLGSPVLFALGVLGLIGVALYRRLGNYQSPQ